MTTPPSKLKTSPIKGRRPVLQNCTIAELLIDPAYQRSVETTSSRTLIRSIARDWDWSLFLPLVVARRADDTLYVVDGQHRLAAARLRSDIYDLPCVITGYDTPAHEAASFVALNRQRRPLTTMDLYKADVAGGAPAALAVERMLADAGLSLTVIADQSKWKPGQISNIGGILRCQRIHGDRITGQALQLIARAWPGQVLQYAGTLFAGIWPVLGALGATADLDVLQMVLSGASQAEWRADIDRAAVDRGLQRSAAPAIVIREAYDEALAEQVDQAA